MAWRRGNHQEHEVTTASVPQAVGDAGRHGQPLPRAQDRRVIAKLQLRFS